MSNNIPYISIYDLKENIYKIYNDINNNYYWSDDFSPEMYVSLAQKGFISTSANYKEYGDILLPEIQKAYAVLNFTDLHISKKVKKLFKKEYNLSTGIDLDTFLPLLTKYHGDECWFTNSYSQLMYKLKDFTLEKNNFKLQTSMLYNKGNITSGEIGYYIGNTYTSLTGFYNRDYTNWGTFQLVLLAKELDSKGISFWNLGHPYMDYKLKIGAKILERGDFLKIWQ